MARTEFPESSSIEYVEYCIDNDALEVKFRKTGTYIYKNVPPLVFSELCQSSSVGHYVAKKVVGAYDYERIDR